MWAICGADIQIMATFFFWNFFIDWVSSVARFSAKRDLLELKIRVIKSLFRQNYAVAEKGCTRVHCYGAVDFLLCYH